MDRAQVLRALRVAGVIFLIGLVAGGALGALVTLAIVPHN